MHPTSSKVLFGKKDATKSSRKPRPLKVFTRSRLGSIKIPRSLRTILLDFTMAFLVESPNDILKFGYEYFKQIRRRKKRINEYGQLFEDDYSDNMSDEGCLPTKLSLCKRCKTEVSTCKECGKLHRVCYSCTKKMGSSPTCALVQPLDRKESDQGDAPITPHRKSRRFCVFSEGLEEGEAKDWEPPTYEKNEEQRKKLTSYLSGKTLFKALEPSELDLIVSAMFLRDVVASEVVIRQGRGGDYFYVIDSGNFRAYVKKDEEGAKILTNYEGHGSFGELALMYNVPRQCSVKALTNGKLWALDRDTFRKIVIQGAMRKRDAHMALLRTVPMLKVLTDFEMMNVADSLDIHHYTSGEKIIEQGEDATGMFFIDEGRVTVSYTDEYGLDVVLDTLQGGAYFGEVALIEKQNRTATVTAATDVTVAFLHRDAFERLLGPCKEIMNRKLEGYGVQREEMVKKANIERRQTEDIRQSIAADEETY